MLEKTQILLGKSHHFCPFSPFLDVARRRGARRVAGAQLQQNLILHHFLPRPPAQEAILNTPRSPTVASHRSSQVRCHVRPYSSENDPFRKRCLRPRSASVLLWTMRPLGSISAFAYVFLRVRMCLSPHLHASISAFACVYLNVCICLSQCLHVSISALACVYLRVDMCLSPRLHMSISALACVYLRVGMCLSQRLPKT